MVPSLIEWVTHKSRKWVVGLNKVVKLRYFLALVHMVGQRPSVLVAGVKWAVSYYKIFCFKYCMPLSFRKRLND